MAVCSCSEGKAFRQQERHFSSEQANTLGALIDGMHDIGHQTGIDPEMYPVFIGCLTDLILEIFQTGDQFILLLDGAEITVPQLIGWIGDHFTLITVDDDFPSIELTEGQIQHTHDRGNTHGPCQNRYM